MMDMATALELGILRSQIETLKALMEVADEEHDGVLRTETIRAGISAAKNQFLVKAQELAKTWRDS